MTNEQVHALLRYVRQVIGPPDGEAGTDGQLLRRFVRHRDEAAFLALVQRHGPMVLGVCHRILRQAQDAEDAFQATFLVLMRNAHAIRDADRLSNWLYGVAVRTASKLKVREARRRKHERRAGTLAGGGREPDGGKADLCPVLDQEIQQLPKKYRTAVLLCYLEGKTNREAAAVLGCPAGTVSSRLAWARQRLRTRLARRGFAPAVGLAGIGLGEGEIGRATAAAVPAELEVRTVQLALEFAAGNAAVGGVSLRVVILTRDVLRAMFWTSWKGLAVMGLVAVSLIGAAVGVYASGMLVAGGPESPAPASQEKEPVKPEALKQEVARLQAEVQKLQEELARLRAKLDAQPNAAEPVLFRGKPAASWIEALKDRDPAYRTDAVKALGGIAEVGRSMIPILIASLKDPGAGVASQAADSLGQLGTAVLPALQEVMKTGTDEVRRKATVALGRIGPDAVPALAKALHDVDGQVVFSAIELLFGIGQTDRGAIDALQAAARDNDVQLRRRVMRGTSDFLRDSGRGSVSFPLGSPLLVEGLNDPDTEVRTFALARLSHLSGGRGTPVPGLVPALLKLLKDPKAAKPLRKDAYELLRLLTRIDPAAKEALDRVEP
jgi:RNA polymerase sigma-70 factor (ECF subfamily)